jgi:hypothetical protein
MKKTSQSTTKFLTLNFNLKKIIFSFLDRHNQRTIYWINKRLRPFLPDSELMINIDTFHMSGFYTFKELDSLKLCGGKFLLKTKYSGEFCEIFNESLCRIKLFPAGTKFPYEIWELKNGNIIDYDSENNLFFYDTNFKLVHKIIFDDDEDNEESGWDIWCFCNIS